MSNRTLPMHAYTNDNVYNALLNGRRRLSSYHTWTQRSLYNTHKTAFCLLGACEYGSVGLVVVRAEPYTMATDRYLLAAINELCGTEHTKRMDISHFNDTLPFNPTGHAHVYRVICRAVEIYEREHPEVVGMKELADLPI